MSTLNVYKASAGSGKTYRLALEYIKLLYASNEPKPHRSTLAVTFTNKATGEMKQRIVKNLYDLATNPESKFLEEIKEDKEVKKAIPNLSDEYIRNKANEFLTDILHDYSKFNVSTIDAFFQQIVRAFTREIGLLGNYGMQMDTDKVLQMAIDNMLFKLDPTQKELLDWLQMMIKDAMDDAGTTNYKASHLIRNLAEQLFNESYAQIAQSLEKVLADKKLIANYKEKLKRDVVDKYETRVKNLCDQGLKIIQDKGLTIEDFKGGSRTSVARVFDYDYLLKNKFIIGKSIIKAVDDESQWYSQSSSRKDDIQSVYPRLNQLLKQIINEDQTDYFTAKVILKNINKLGILKDVYEQIKTDCGDENVMLINETNKFLRQIIDNSDAPFIYEKVGVKLHHFMLDEFQDTSAMQWDNFKPLIQNSLSEGNDNLIVGDVKQSIYRWRNSDWRLLQSGVEKDFPREYHQTPLNTNWRSAENVVTFNNDFFAKVPDLFIPQVDDDKLHKLLEAIYAGVKQETHDTTKGHVKLHLFADQKDNRWTNQALENIPSIIDSLKEKGYCLKDIAILVRRGIEAKTVAEYLLKQDKNYAVVSNEALQIKPATGVQFIVAFMQFLTNPTDAFLRATVTYIYNNKIANNNKAFEVQEGQDPMEWLNDLLGLQEEKNKINIQSLYSKSLFQLVEFLIQIFNLKQRSNELVYLQAFQDEVFAYEANNRSDINNFLEYWDEISYKKYVAASESQDAIRILTVHKSKGLEFNAVIVPFCEWEFNGSKESKNFLWCDTAGMPDIFQEIPILPINITNDATSRTHFAVQCEQERQARIVDELNVAYVAFTRAKNELYVMAPAKDVKEPKSVSDLLNLFVNEADNDMKVMQASNSNDLIAERGNLDKFEQKEGNDVIDSIPISYDTQDAQKRLQLRFSPDDSCEDRRYGKLMHDILSEIEVKDDLEKALEKFHKQGDLTTAEMEEKRDILLRLLSKQEVKEWFSGKYEVRNEHEIVQYQKRSERPDRIMIKGDEVIVVDYKFGEHKEAKYFTQVSSYMRLLQQIGYKPKGYIWYTTLDEIVPVELRN